MTTYMHVDAMIGKHKPYRLEGISCRHMCCISVNSNLGLLQLCLNKKKKKNFTSFARTTRPGTGQLQKPYLLSNDTLFRAHLRALMGAAFGTPGVD